VSSVCVSCGAESSEGARFCQVCGASLWAACPACGAEQSAAATFCSSCGTALRPEAGRATEADHEERRVVTVLFADLAGSTAFGESVDPEDVREVQSALFDLVGREVERHGGVTEKFVGDAVVAVFGAPQAHEDDAERAVRAALAIRDAFPRLAARIADRHGADVGIRIGVNTGEVVAGREAMARGELMVTGDAVNVAARLQQLTAPGTVLVGERTRLTTQRSVIYGDVQELDAKGKELPIRAWEAVRPHLSRPLRARAFATPLVGRADELSLLQLTASRVERERAPQLVTVFGNAGVGKSRLLEEFADALDRGRVLTGRCVPYGDGITYLPLAEVASQLTGIRDDDPSDVALGRARQTVDGLVAPSQADQAAAALAWTLGLTLPEGAAGIAAVDPRRALHEGWASLLTALGREELFVLVVDDVHWASEPLLDLIEDVVQRLHDTAVLVVCPARPELVDARPSWAASGLRSSAITLAPLDERSAETLLRELLRAEDVPEHIARSILVPAEGNPFFVEEMLSMLVERGALERRNGGWSVTPHLEGVKVPDSIHGVIAARIDLLRAAEREALRRCSVMGRSFWPDAVGVDDDVVATLARRALVSERHVSSFSAREFTFKHALTHEVAYSTLPRGERRELHRRVAEWIAERAPDRQAETTEVIAYHYEQALAYGDRNHGLERRLFDALLNAGVAAVARGAYASADALLTRALEVAPSEVEHARASVLLARVEVATRRYDTAIERLGAALAVAEREGDLTLQAEALGGKTRASWLRGSWRDAVESAQAAVNALEGLPESPQLAWALARLSQIEMLRGLPEAEPTSQRAIDVARRTGERAAEANARGNLMSARSRWAAPTEAELTEIIELAQAAGAHDESARVVINYLWSACRFQPLDALERTVMDAAGEVGIGLATEGYGQYLAFSRAALLHVPAGRWSEVDAMLASADPGPTVTVRLVWLWLVTGMALRHGDLQEVDRHLPEFRETALASEEPQRIWPMVSVTIPRALLDNDLETVRQLADIVMEGSPSWAFMSALSIARSLAVVEDGERLARLVQVLQEDAGSESVVLVAHGLLALLDGRAQEAAEILADAERQLQAFGRHYDAACVALDAGRALDAAGDSAGAETTRQRADEFLDTIGCINPW
jgi:class 3 adenylate cyclase/tetratricopeptide (TPR) repeat protein